MDDANKRLDYFRSEIKADMEKLQKHVDQQLTEQLRILRDFEKRLEKVMTELKNVGRSL